MRQILHLDLDAFFASVEVLLNPELKDKPLVVAYDGPRSVVTTASYPARKFGVHSAMPLARAKQLCPQAIVVPPRRRTYSEYSQRVMAILREHSPLVEQVSIDEAYVEIPAEQNAGEVALAIQQRIKNEIGLDCTVAVASNKLVSKVACNRVKPHGFIVVPDGDEANYLAPLPIEKLPGAGQATRAKLVRWRVQTIGDLARVPVAELRAVFGKVGVYLHDAANGRDDSPIVTDWKPKSVSQENTFERDIRDAAQIEKWILEMSEGVARELQHEGYLARTVIIKLRYGDFTTLTRQTTLRVPTANADAIQECARQLLRTHWNQKRALRLVGVGAHNLIEESGTWQMELGEM